jgi:hypothetical protein
MIKFSGIYIYSQHHLQASAWEPATTPGFPKRVSLYRWAGRHELDSRWGDRLTHATFKTTASVLRHFWVWCSRSLVATELPIVRRLREEGFKRAPDCFLWRITTSVIICWEIIKLISRWISSSRQSRSHNYDATTLHSRLQGHPNVIHAAGLRFCAEPIIAWETCLAGHNIPSARGIHPPFQGLLLQR